MDKSLVKFAKGGDPSLLVWRVPATLTEEGADGIQIYALPLMSRPGGALYALPEKSLSADMLLDAMMRDEPGLVGPSCEFSAQLIIEDDTGSGVIELGVSSTFVVVDLEDSILTDMREYDPVTDSTEDIFPFSQNEPNALPKVLTALPLVAEWIENLAHERLNFYSAREEPDLPVVPSPKKAAQKRAAKPTIAGLSAQLLTVQQQLQAVMAHQESLAVAGQQLSGHAAPAVELRSGVVPVTMPALSSGLIGGTAPKVAATLLGPPPKTKAAAEQSVAGVGPNAVLIQGGPGFSGEMTMEQTLSQQSMALTQLVAHLTGGDPMSDLAGSSSTTGLSFGTKGVARREKLQSELASRTSTFFLQVQQQLFKRMNPARVVPRTAEELSQADVSMTSYLERYGGFKNNREAGLIMWILAHAMDAAAQEDFHATKEYMALLAASLEQSVLDGGWNVAYILSLMEEPPQQLFSERQQPMASSGRPFSPLVPPQWAAVALSYLKEIEVLSTRKVEMRRPPAKATTGESDPAAPASPKRKPRFPKKPKAGREISP